jgi:hypothetical protein
MEANKKVIGFTKDVTRRLQSALGDDLLGVYLHGSAAMEAFQYQRSDIDMLAISKRELEDAERRLVGEVLMDPEMPCPGIGLEFTLVTDASLDVASKSPAFEVHLTTLPHDRKFVDGRDREGDPDLILHYAMCRARGRAVLGPAPQVILPDVPRDWVLEAMLDELEWALENAPPHYTILNACRAICYAETGNLVSKLEGGHWFTRTRKHTGPVHYALREQTGRAKVRPTDLQAGAIVEIAQEALNDALWEEKANA